MLATRYEQVRKTTEAICRPLAIEDYGVQPMADASPPKWHLAHTTWFFETFLLKAFVTGYRPFHERFEYLFNSYYNGIGHPYPRARRGALSRPTVAEVLQYREHVDAAMAALLARGDEQIDSRIELGLHHEQQHQELLLTDIKYTLGTNPLLPAYRSDLCTAAAAGPNDRARTRTYTEFDGGIIGIGAAADEGFCFDNELPRHEVMLRPFALADAPVTNGEFLAFVEDAGYERPELWLSDGWAALSAAPSIRAADRPPAADGRSGPLYWYRRDGEWYEYRLSGPTPVEPRAPVAHVNYYEADAFARWSGRRLPTEQEWERAAVGRPVSGNFADTQALHPLPPARPEAGSLRALFGDVWEWTSSPYMPYPGYRPLPGTLGEYNGKFMSNQLVLRGGSCVTQPNHMRLTYRNFFYPGDRWQFSGIRLAQDI
ncbi:MAG: ergothioneine biosynthesis protein EgtB [Pseudomonadales bacterium]